MGEVGGGWVPLGGCWGGGSLAMGGYKINVFPPIRFPFKIKVLYYRTMMGLFKIC